MIGTTPQNLDLFPKVDLSRRQVVVPQRVQIIFIIHLDVSDTSTELADFPKAPREAVAVGRERSIERGPGRDICYVF